MPPLGRFHVLTDETLQTRFSHLDVALLALDGGADAVQYREKRPLPTRQLVATALTIAAVCRGAARTCIVDDRADVAFAAGADGVHLGRDDLEASHVRRLVGDRVLIGGTANSLAEARAAFGTPIDYLGVGPVFGTHSKANPAPVLGLDLLRAIAAESPVPVIAIGNIGPEQVAAVLQAGAHGIAVLSGVTCAPDPAAAAAVYAEALAAWLGSEAGTA